MMLTRLLYQEIGREAHETDQNFVILSGEGTVQINDEPDIHVGMGSVFLVHAGAQHNVISGSQPLILLTIYGATNLHGPHDKEGCR